MAVRAERSEGLEDRSDPGSLVARGPLILQGDAGSVHCIGDAQRRVTTIVHVGTFPEVPARPRAAPTAPGPLHMINYIIGL